MGVVGGEMPASCPERRQRPRFAQVALAYSVYPQHYIRRQLARHDAGLLNHERLRRIASGQTGVRSGSAFTCQGTDSRRCFTSALVVPRSGLPSEHQGTTPRSRDEWPRDHGCQWSQRRTRCLLCLGDNWHQSRRIQLRVPVSRGAASCAVVAPPPLLEPGDERSPDSRLVPTSAQGADEPRGFTRPSDAP